MIPVSLFLLSISILLYLWGNKKKEELIKLKLKYKPIEDVTAFVEREHAEIREFKQIASDMVSEELEKAKSDSHRIREEASQDAREELEAARLQVKKIAEKLDKLQSLYKQKKSELDVIENELRLKAKEIHNQTQGVTTPGHSSERDRLVGISDPTSALIPRQNALLTVHQNRHGTTWKDEKDAWEQSDLDYGQYGKSVVFERSGPGAAKSSTILEIEYEDRNGVKSKRQIRVREVSFNTDLTNAGIYAHCYVRQAGRMFIASRISRCVDTRTGEVIANIPAFLISEYKCSTYGRIESLRESHSDEIAALVYVSKVDGRSTKVKKSAIAIYLLDSSDCDGLSEADIIEDLKNETVLSRTQFQRCVGRLSRLDNLNRDALVGAVRSVINSSKSPPSPLENEALNYIAKKLS